MVINNTSGGFLERAKGMNPYINTTEKVSDIWSGGGLDNKGDLGWLGDFGGMIAGTFGENNNAGFDLSTLPFIGMQAWDYFQTQDDARSVSDDIRNAADEGIGAVNNLMSPYSNAGRAGVEGFLSLLANPSSVTSLPGYEFRRQQGQQAIERSAAAKGMLQSGNNLTNIMDYNQNYATQAYGEELNRRLSLANLGAAVAPGQATALADLYNRKGEASGTRELIQAQNRQNLIEGLVSLNQMNRPAQYMYGGNIPGTPGFNPSAPSPTQGRGGNSITVGGQTIDLGNIYDLPTNIADMFNKGMSNIEDLFSKGWDGDLGSIKIPEFDVPTPF